MGGDLLEIDAQIDKIRRNTGANMFGTGLDRKQVKFQAEVLAYLSDTLAKLEAAQAAAQAAQPELKYTNAYRAK